jgi:hypothetical protein
MWILIYFFFCRVRFEAITVEFFTRVRFETVRMVFWRCDAVFLVGTGCVFGLASGWRVRCKKISMGAVVAAACDRDGE